MLGISAQTHNGANDLFLSGNYEDAQLAYGKLLKSYPTNALYLYRYARCAQEQGDYSTALKYFEKAGDRYMLKYFYLGEIYMQQWMPEQAIAAYDTYLKSQKEPNERKDYIQAQIRFAQKLRRYLRRVEQLQVIDSIQVPMDSMLLVCQLSAEAGSLTLDANHSVVYTNQRGDRRFQAAAVDSGKVIVSSHRLLDDWTHADTLPAIVNFTSIQCSPYLLNDGVTLYFAANDSNGLGGLDIYVSRYNMSTESYTMPENIGMPYNSPANEYLYVIDEIRQIGYLATDRFAKDGYVHVYSFMLPERKQYYSLSDSLVAYARLECFEQALLSEQITQEHTNVLTNDYMTIEPIEEPFVVNDSVVCYSLTEFKSHAAREKYHEWQIVLRQYQTEQKQLESLRAEYAIVDEDRQKELASIILRLENNQSQLQLRCDNLLQEIRLAEIRARQSL